LLSSKDVLIGLSKVARTKDKGYQFDRIYRNFYIPDMYKKTYSNIYSNKGSATRGITSETAKTNTYKIGISSWGIRYKNKKSDNNI